MSEGRRYARYRFWIEGQAPSRQPGSLESLASALCCMGLPTEEASETAFCCVLMWRRERFGDDLSM